MRPPPVRIRQTVWAGKAGFLQRFYTLQTKLPPKLSLFPQKVARQQRSRSGEMKDVIKGCKNHQHEDDCQPDPEPHLLRPLRQRTTANRLDDIEQKVTTIEERDGEQVQQANRNREYGCQMYERREADGRDLA